MHTGSTTKKTQEEEVWELSESHLLIRGALTLRPKEPGTAGAGRLTGVSF